MNKSELAEKIAEIADIPIMSAYFALNAFISAVTEALSGGSKVSLKGFGVFEVRDRSARTGRNPSTGEMMQIPAIKMPAFKASKTLKAAVN